MVNCSDADVERMLAGVPVVSSSADALRRGQFAGLFDFAATPAAAAGFTRHPQNDAVSFRTSAELPADDIDEHWRNVFVDVTSPGVDVSSPAFVEHGQKAHLWRGVARQDGLLS